MFARKSWPFPPVEGAKAGPGPSIWCLQAAVIAFLLAVVIPATFTLNDFINAAPDMLQRLAEARRKRQRQTIPPTTA